MRKTKISLIILGILIFTSFIPVLKILIMHLNGAILALLSYHFGSEGLTVILVVNGLLTSIFLILFYLFKSIAGKVFSAIGVILFFLPLLVYSTENIISNEKYYFLQFLITGAIVGSTLFLIEIYKSKLMDNVN